MVSKHQAGSQAYLIESNRIIREVTVVSCRSDFYIVRFAGNSGNGGIQVRGSRLFPTREDAEHSIPATHKITSQKKNGFRSPYDYGL